MEERYIEIMSEKDFNKGCWYGILIGIIIMSSIWWLMAGIIEETKVKAGYLTYKKDIYRVKKVIDYDILIKDVKNSYTGVSE